MRQPSPHSALIAFAAIATSCQAAGWSGVWPSEQHPRETYRQLSECYTAVVERCRLWPVDAPAAPVWYRSNRATLIELKAHLLLTAQVSGWINTNTTGTGTAVLSGQWLTENLGSDFPVYGNVGAGNAIRTNLLKALRMPTNYFEYVPYRCLDGLGPFTNDVSTPYPHGYTNATTAAGGTNFPTGRAVWYTTDYGWNKLPAIINALTVTRHDAASFDVSYFAGQTTVGSTYTWSDAVNSACANYKVDAGWSEVFYGSWGWITGSDPVEYSCRIQMALHFFGPVNVSTSFASFGYYYVYPERYPTDATFTNSVFDPHGDPLTETNYCLAATDPSNVWGSVYSTLFGSTNFPTITAQPAPSVRFATRGTARGWRQWSQSPRSYRRWTVAGGFTFY